ncbi:MAG: T9SS type A sorting domain-containing protein [Bacteroidota bacterium]
MKRIFTSTLLLSLLTCFKSQAILPGVYTIPSPAYLTLASIITILNNEGITGSGNVTINLNIDQTAPGGGYVLGSAILNATLSATSTLTINGTGLTGKTITAPVGSGNNDAIFSIQGSDFVTINKLHLVESAANTTATTKMEKGYAITKLNSNDGCKTLSIKDCKITLDNTNNTAAAGITPYGATGIYIGNCTPFSNAALTAPTVFDGAHEGIFINKDTITNVNHGVYGNGTGLVIDGIAFNDKTILVHENVIENFTHNGVYLVFFDNDEVRKNKINNLASGGVAPTANSIIGVFYNGATVATNNNWTCEQNVIDLTIGGSGFAATGIYSQIIGTGTSTINDDTIKLTASGTTGQLIGIWGRNGNGTTTINRNYIYDFTVPSTNNLNLAGIWNGQTAAPVGYPTVCKITNNTISNFTIAGAATVFGCVDQNVANTNPSVFTGNTVSDFSISGTVTAFKGYQFRNTISTGTIILTATDNTFKNINAASTAIPMTILDPAANITVNGNLSNNRFENIAAGTGFLTGVQLDFAKSMVMNSDTFINLSGGADVIAYKAGYGGTAVQTLSFNKNFIDQLSSTGTSSFVEGLKITTGTSNFTAACSFTNGIIKKLSATGTGATANGVFTAGGTTTYNFSNNFISDIAASNNTGAYSSSFGFNLTNTGSNNVLFNTVNLTSTIGGAYGATGLLFSPGATNTIQNNILRVNVSAGAANNVAAIRALSGAALVPPSMSGFTAGSNIYYTPMGSNNYLYVEGTTNATLVNGYHINGLSANAAKNIVNDKFFNSECDKSAYHNFMKTTGIAVRERKTFTEDNLSGLDGVFSPVGMSYAESVALDVSVSIDFSSDPRPSGSSDIGALEFKGTTLPQMVIEITSSTGYDTACIFNLPVLNSSIPAFFNKVSYQWFRDDLLLPGDTFKSLLVKPISANYTLKVYDSTTGCDYFSERFKMTIVPPPPAQITYYDSLTFCESSAIVLQANKGYNYTYQWMRNSSILPGETNDHLVVDKSGDYMLEVNTPLGCASYSVPVRVKVYPLPKPTIVYGGPGKLTTQKYFLYQWYKNNVKIDSFATNRDFYTLFGKDGAYSVEVTDSNGCTAKSDIYLFATGIDEGLVNSTIKIFPNPMVDQLHIISSVEVNARLTDITGRVVAEQRNAKVIETATLAEGMYLLTLTDKEGKLIRIEKVNKTK